MYIFVCVCMYMYVYWRALLACMYVLCVLCVSCVCVSDRDWIWSPCKALDVESKTVLSHAGEYPPLNVTGDELESARLGTHHI